MSEELEILCQSRGMCCDGSPLLRPGGARGGRSGERATAFASTSWAAEGQLRAALVQRWCPPGRRRTDDARAPSTSSALSRAGASCAASTTGTGAKARSRPGAEAAAACARSRADLESCGLTPADFEADGDAATSRPDERAASGAFTEADGAARSGLRPRRVTGRAFARLWAVLTRTAPSRAFARLWAVQLRTAPTPTNLAIFSPVHQTSSRSTEWFRWSSGKPSWSNTSLVPLAVGVQLETDNGVQPLGPRLGALHAWTRLACRAPAPRDGRCRGRRRRRSSAPLGRLSRGRRASGLLEPAQVDQRHSGSRVPQAKSEEPARATS